MSEPRRSLPAIHRFLDDPSIAAFEAAIGRDEIKANVTRVLDQARQAFASTVPPYAALRSAVLERLADSASENLRGVINATGILLHTNLGRAPLAAEARAAVDRVSRGYANLEYDLAGGKRGSRYDHASDLICRVTGAQAALVVNNCAGAVLLILDTFAKGREVIVARSQLIEIGGGFRLPDVLERSGATLVEVGATNKVYAEDYRRVLSARTALLLRSHPSNYRLSGFTHDVAPNELTKVAHDAGLPAVEDLGSGALVDLHAYGLPHERTAQEALADGFDLVAFSGDKLVGGPQAGIIAGSPPLIARLRANPLLRALRVDKMTLAALDATLRLYSLEKHENIPLYAMLSRTPESLRDRAAHYVNELPLEVVETQAFLGGGSLPEDALPSIGLALDFREGPDAAAERLRRSDPPIVARIENGHVVLDLRTISPEDDDRVMSALRAIA